MSNGESFVAADDAFVSPTYIPDLVRACLDLLIDGECGVWHLANVGEISWVEFARRGAEVAGIMSPEIEGRPTRNLGLAARRPLYSVLGSERGVLLPSLECALNRYFNECEVKWTRDINEDYADLVFA